MRRTAFRRTSIRIGLVGLLIGATLAYGRLEKTVTVRIEGGIRPLRTFAPTVGAALDRARIAVGPNDRVSPSLRAALHDGDVIHLWRAKTVTLVLNGRPREVIVTAPTVDELLREIALRSSARDYMGASRSARVYAGMVLVYRQAVAVTVTADDKTKRVVTAEGSIRALLSDLGVKLGAKDKVVPPAGTYPQQGMAVRVLRVGLRNEIVEEAIPSPVRHKRKMNQEYGTTRVLSQGLQGLRVYRYLTTFVDGRRVKRKLLGVKVVRKPQPRVIGIGAGFPGCVCKKGSQTGKGTWYDANGLTAAHPTLPFGTVVRVTNLANGKSVNVVIRDRGPRGPGRIIDMSANAFGRIARLGTGIIRVKIRW